jgi:very-short-patch-repair endonuclease
VHDILVDFYWPEARLVVELDGFAWHKTRESFEEDRRHDAILQLAGIAVVRLTDARIKNGARSVVAELRRLIANRQDLL